MEDVGVISNLDPHALEDGSIRRNYIGCRHRRLAAHVPELSARSRAEDQNQLTAASAVAKQHKDTAYAIQIFLYQFGCSSISPSCDARCGYRTAGTATGH